MYYTPVHSFRDAAQSGKEASARHRRVPRRRKAKNHEDDEDDDDVEDDFTGLHGQTRVRTRGTVSVADYEI